MVALTKQAVLNKVTKHLITQNRKSFDKETQTCQYKAANGDMCALGCLIPNDKYKPNMEGQTVCQPVVYNTIKDIMTDDAFDIAFLECLQNIHDETRPSRWPGALRKLAKIHNLTIPSIIKL